MLTDKDGNWLCDKKGLLNQYKDRPEYVFGYVVDARFCQYRWTDKEYAILAEMLPGGNLLVSASLEPLDDIYQDSSWIISNYKTHEKIMSFFEMRRERSSSYGIKLSQKLFVLMYQMPSEYLPLFIDDKSKEITIIVQWRLQHATR